MIDPIDNIAIDWKLLLATLNQTDFDLQNGLDNYPLENLLPGVLENYNGPHNQYKVYTSSTITDFVPELFFTKHNIDTDNYVVKILEHAPGSFSNPHIDTYKTLLRMKNLPEQTKIKRFWIPCENHKFGHALFVNEDIVCNYKAGDVFEIPQGVIHSAANAGTEKKIILTITGVINE